jgi:hypothetical protein
MNTVTTGLDKKVLRINFGPNKQEITGEWRKIHNDELHTLEINLTNIIK